MAQQRRAEHRTILVLDVERFGDWRRTNANQVTVRDGMYGALQRTFREAGIPWDGCHKEDRGDGVFFLAQHAFTGFSDALGVTHPYALSAATTYANDLHATGDYPAALELLEATYVSFKEVLGKLHPYTLACGVNLIEELHSTGHEEGAALLADAVKERYAEVLGEEHPEVVAGRTLGVPGECSTDAPHT